MHLALPVSGPRPITLSGPKRARTPGGWTSEVRLHGQGKDDGLFVMKRGGDALPPDGDVGAKRTWDVAYLADV
jgi:hypothetical protein